MSSIRPLVTITILVVVGAYLYVKINQGPMQPHTGANTPWSQSPDGVPPLSATKGASLAADTTAPAWPSTAAPVAPPTTVPTASSNPSATSAAPATVSNSSTKDGLPAVPPIPELPPLPATAATTPPATQLAATLSKDLPANIPTAQYGEEANQSPTATSATDSLTKSTPSTLNVNTATPEKTAPPVAATPSSVTPSTAAPAIPAEPMSNTQNAATSNTSPQPASAQSASSSPASTAQASIQNAMQSSPDTSTAVAGEPDRYAITSPTTTPLASAPSAMAPPAAAPSSPIQAATAAGASTFAASWPAIQTALKNGDLKQAHLLLSKWHNNDSLSPAEAQRVETLLSQLAGTVIYSTEHRLEPPRFVKPGETLETIAKEYNVPWQLLAKINGITSPNELRPSQQLKVVRGPFSAVVDVHRSELTLMVDDRYAGKFHVTVPPGISLAGGEWLVDKKLTSPQSASPASAYPSTASMPERTIVLRNTVAAPTTGTPTLLIASGKVTGLPASQATINVSPQDAEEIADILSIGSRVTIRR
ncbi:MAG TPA: LysM peptidoglycan-binding domain-containing protein [Lacipirellulaceae bacterium]|nr:LysM peptidoglycan-binding domain-containing protein [Lacipirellulaceae bacterium]